MFIVPTRTVLIITTNILVKVIVNFHLQAFNQNSLVYEISTFDILDDENTFYKIIFHTFFLLLFADSDGIFRPVAVVIHLN